MTPSPIFDLGGKGAVITGATRGIGRAIAEAFAAHGAHVVVSSRKPEACEQVATQINARGQGRATPIAATIGSKESLANLVAASAAALGHIDILVCNAATNPHFGSMASISDAQFEKVLHNNVLASHWLCQLVAPGMIARGGGSIILVSSIGGLRGSSVIGAYNISKAADFQLARNLAVELGSHGVRVNCIAPGLIKTDFSRALWEDEQNLARALASTPLQRIGLPEEVAGAAVFLASPAGAYVTGQSIVVDGGATIAAAGV
jgi:NAD(P)-dependent dehydrogenase (short-subunit alcohol dehydrogenase family)